MIKPIHPFPARMAPSLVHDYLESLKKPSVILDPMSGSGTTIASARLRGHKVIGCDLDPLAVLISTAWAYEVDPNVLQSKVGEVVSRAKKIYSSLKLSDSYPRAADKETKAFIRYWFDATNRKQLFSLSTSISRVRDEKIRNCLWVAFSRMIITKVSGVSLAMDVSHSRPHRVYDIAPETAFALFPGSVDRVSNALHKNQLSSVDVEKKYAASMFLADARKIPLKNKSVDHIITSPPYLNAIDYMRGHRLSLVWMNYSLKELRNIRSTSVGSEIVMRSNDEVALKIANAACEFGNLPETQKGFLLNYISGLDSVIREYKRVLKKGGSLFAVLGDSTLKNVFIRNSTAFSLIAEQHGLTCIKTRSRPLESKRRYLPPPRSGDKSQITMRMKEEVLLTFSA